MKLNSTHADHCTKLSQVNSCIVYVCQLDLLSLFCKAIKQKLHSVVVLLFVSLGNL